MCTTFASRQGLEQSRHARSNRWWIIVSFCFISTWFVWAKFLLKSTFSLPYFGIVLALAGARNYRKILSKAPSDKLIRVNAVASCNNDLQLLRKLVSLEHYKTRGLNKTTSSSPLSLVRNSKCTSLLHWEILQTAIGSHSNNVQLASFSTTSNIIRLSSSQHLQMPSLVEIRMRNFLRVYSSWSYLPLSCSM